MPAARHVVCHPEGEARLPDRRTCREDDEVAGGEALGVIVELAEPRRDPREVERPLHSLGQVLVVGLQRRGDVPQLGVGRFVAEREEPLLGTVEGERDVGGLVVRIGSDRGRRAEEASQDGPIAHHVRVTLDLDRGRHAVGKAAKVGLTSGAVELLAPRELDLDRDRIDPLAALEERLRRGVDALVPREVEVVHAQQVCDLEDRVAVGEQAAEDVLLGGFVERDPPVGRGGSLERHLEIIEHPFHSGKQKPTGTSKKPRFGKLAGTKVSCGISPRHGDDVHRLLHQFRPPRMHRRPVRWTKRLPHSIESAWSCVSS